MTAAEFVQDELIARNWNMSILQRRSELSNEQLHRFFSRQISLTPEFAQGFSKAFGTNLQHWLNLERAIKTLNL